MQPALRTPLCFCRVAQGHSAIPYMRGNPGPRPAPQQGPGHGAVPPLPSAGANQASCAALKSASLHKVSLLLLTPSKVLLVRRRRQGCNSFPTWKQVFHKDPLRAAPHSPISLALHLQPPLSGTCWKSFWPIKQLVLFEQNWK